MALPQGTWTIRAPVGFLWLDGSAFLDASQVPAHCQDAGKGIFALGGPLDKKVTTFMASYKSRAADSGPRRKWVDHTQVGHTETAGRGVHRPPGRWLRTTPTQPTDRGEATRRVPKDVAPGSSPDPKDSEPCRSRGKCRFAVFSPTAPALVG